MYIGYSDEAILILTKELMRERAANPALAIIRKERAPRRSRSHAQAQAMEAQLDRARTRAIAYVHA